MSQAQSLLLRRLLGCLIPPGGPYDLPGADDPAIVAEVVITLTQRGVELAPLLDELDDRDLADCSTASVQALVDRLRQVDGLAMDGLIVALTQCYYRNDRVLEQLAMEARPPFPKGFAVEEGDWSLLTPVRARGRIWRET